MFQGRANIQALATEVTRQANARRDFIARANALQVTPNGQIDLSNGFYGINELAHGQMAEYADVPKAYYDRIRAGQPALYANTVNTLLAAKPAADSQDYDRASQLENYGGTVLANQLPAPEALPQRVTARRTRVRANYAVAGTN